MRVAVIGAGAAGAAASWYAARGSGEVVLVHEGAGAVSLYSGALDLEPWESPETGVLGHEELAFVTAMDTWSVGATACRIATPAGMIRRARGIDTALLNLEPLAGRNIAVPDSAVSGWDGDLLARELSRSAWAEETQTSFEAVDVAWLSEASARVGSDYDLAQQLTDSTRAKELVQSLSAASNSHDAWLLGPWLGTEPETSEGVRAELGVPVGETTSGPNGPAGRRFEVSRDRLLAELADSGVHVKRARVVGLERAASLWSLRLEDSKPGASDLVVDAVVLATGGVAAGGIVLDSEAEAYRSGTSFHLSLEAPVRFELDGEDVDASATMHGFDIERFGMRALERIGIRAEGPAVCGAERLYVAGDAQAGRPRTVLEAVRSGIAAGRAAIAD